MNRMYLRVVKISFFIFRAGTVIIELRGFLLEDKHCNVHKSLAFQTISCFVMCSVNSLITH